MSENLHSPEKINSHHTIHTIWGEHTPPGIDPKWDSTWSPNIVNQVVSIDPDQVVVDSIPGNVIISYLSKLNPLAGTKNDTRSKRRYVIGADVMVEEMDRQDEVLWKVLAKTDPIIDKKLENPQREIENIVGAEIGKSYEIEGVAIGVLTLCALYHRRNQTMTRRQFLKLAGASAVVGVSETLSRGALLGALFSSIHDNADVEKNESFGKLMQIVKPALFHSTYIDIRNIKAGLAAYDHERKVNKSNDPFNSAIVFGSGHVMETDPSKDEGLLLEKMRKYLEVIQEYLPSFYEERNQKAMVRKIRKMFGDYVSYELKPENYDNYSAKSESIDSVNKIINELFDAKKEGHHSNE